MILSKENNGARRLSSTLKQLNWMTQMRHTIAIEQLLIWNLAGILSIIHFDHFCLKSELSSYVHWILCSFKQAEADCDQALLLDKKVSDFLLISRPFSIATYHYCLLLLWRHQKFTILMFLCCCCLRMSKHIYDEAPQKSGFWITKKHSKVWQFSGM
jgi:hypothetical protein